MAAYRGAYRAVQNTPAGIQHTQRHLYLQDPSWHVKWQLLIFFFFLSPALLRLAGKNHKHPPSERNFGEKQGPSQSHQTQPLLLCHDVQASNYPAAPSAGNFITLQQPGLGTNRTD